MTIEEGIVEWLLNDTGVASRVGSEVYQMLLPQSPVLPAVRVQLIDVIDRYHLRGGVTLTTNRIQTDAFARESSGGDPYAEAADLGDEVFAALSGRRFYTGGTPPTFFVTGAFRVLRRPLREDDETRTVRMWQDFLVWCRQT